MDIFQKKFDKEQIKGKETEALWTEKRIAECPGSKMNLSLRVPFLK
jgi:hypothetical protein